MKDGWDVRWVYALIGAILALIALWALYEGFTSLR